MAKSRLFLRKWVDFVKVKIIYQNGQNSNCNRQIILFYVERKRFWGLNFFVYQKNITNMVIWLIDTKYKPRPIIESLMTFYFCQLNYQFLTKQTFPVCYKQNPDLAISWTVIYYFVYGNYFSLKCYWVNDLLLTTNLRLE